MSQERNTMKVKTRADMPLQVRDMAAASVSSQMAALRTTVVFLYVYTCACVIVCCQFNINKGPRLGTTTGPSSVSSAWSSHTATPGLELS